MGSTASLIFFYLKLLFGLVSVVILFLFILITHLLRKRRKRLDQNVPRMFLKMKVLKDNVKQPFVTNTVLGNIWDVLKQAKALISFEIHADFEGINYWAVLESHDEEELDFVYNSLRDEVLAAFPKIQFETLRDPLLESVNVSDINLTACRQLKLSTSFVYPIKTFKDFEKIDPQAGITTAMSNLKRGEHVAFQLILNPVDKSWHKLSLDEIESIEKGEEKKNPILAVIMFVLEQLLSITGEFIDSLMGHDFKEDKETESDKEKHVVDLIKENPIKGIRGKMTEKAFDTEIRIFVFGANKKRAQLLSDRVASSFGVFNRDFGNSFEAVKKRFTESERLKTLVRYFPVWRGFSGSGRQILNTEELAGIYHFPTMTVETPGIEKIAAREVKAPAELVKFHPEHLLIGINKYAGREDKVFLSTEERRHHTYIIGQTGTGKSTLLLNMIASDCMAGNGFALLDPHGDLALDVLQIIPKNRLSDVIYLDPTREDRTFGFNIMEWGRGRGIDLSIIVSQVVGVFKTRFVESWGPRSEDLLRTTIQPLIDVEQGFTLLEELQTLTDFRFRRWLKTVARDRTIFDELDKMPAGLRLRVTNPIVNKLRHYLSIEKLYRILAQSKSTIDIKEIMDEGKILIVNLSKGGLGSDASDLLGSLLVSKIQIEAMRRVNIPPEERRDFYLYVDEFQNFMTGSFAEILSEARKYRLNLILANQYVGQMTKEVEKALFGNVGNLIAFKLGVDDAGLLERHFLNRFPQSDLLSLPRFKMYARLGVEGRDEIASLESIPPIHLEKVNKVEDMQERSLVYTKPLKEIEEEINQRKKKIDELIGVKRGIH